jgi:23S rRNA (guanosine2251-2'-O)-methyltransferase
MSSSDFIFGLRAIIEAINAGKEIEKVILKKGLQGELYKELFDLIREKDIPFQMVPIERINRITRKNHQGAVAYVSLIEYQSVENILMTAFEKGETPFFIVLDGLTDVRNFGAIARTAECAGVHGIIVPEKGSVSITADAIKTSAGALHEIPVCRVKNLIRTVEYLKDSGLLIVAATEKGAEDYFNCSLDKPVALVMGGEDIGISPTIIRMADVFCKIPMIGKIGSLNVSVAAGIILYEVVRQRSK